MDRALLIGLAGVIGLGWGFAADRIAARWPPHDDGSIRPIDWRTPLVVIAGGLSLAATVGRFGADPVNLVVVGVYVTALVPLFAIDLDQRLLPDRVTLPLIALAVALLALGASPFVSGTEPILWAVAGAIVVPLVLWVLAIPFGAGAIGQGDLKLLAGFGLFAGADRLVMGLFTGALGAGVVIVVLVLARRISLRSYVPYGPFLIAGALWALLGVADG
jgi:leader peptidase (prepilin peptidase)/N-methyltransferase